MGISVEIKIEGPQNVVSVRGTGKGTSLQELSLLLTEMEILKAQVLAEITKKRAPYVGDLKP